jgi:hypothetical protein
LMDALAIGGALAEHGPSEEAVASYGQAQLGPARRLALAGRRWSESFLGG